MWKWRSRLDAAQHEPRGTLMGVGACSILRYHEDFPENLHEVGQLQ